MVFFAPISSHYHVLFDLLLVHQNILLFLLSLCVEFFHCCHKQCTVSHGGGSSNLITCWEILFRTENSKWCGNIHDAVVGVMKLAVN